MASARPHDSRSEINDMEAGERQENSTCQDVLDAPPHMFAEALEGKPRSRLSPAIRHAWARATLSRELVAPH